MSRQWISVIVFLAAAGLVGYLAYTGVTVNSACAWIERQLGVRLKSPEVKNVPHPAYSPIAVPAGK